MDKSKELGNLSINKLLVKQSVPAAIGILVMSVYMIADTIFVGQWVGSMAIAAITVVMPITFLVASLGMSIGIGGASIIARALGAGEKELAYRTFGNQITMTIGLVIAAIIPFWFFSDPILLFFGGKGEILEHAKTYFNILILGVPFLAFAMMSNNVIRSQGFPKVAMNIMLIPAILNIILDPIFIKVFDWGLAGAAAATVVGYLASASYAFWFFVFGKNELKISLQHLKLKAKVVNEINSLGIVTLARQGSISILAIILNNSLFIYGGEIFVAVYGIISRVMMFALFPILGLTQGILPIAGYNYGAKLYPRVKESITKAILYGIGIASMIYFVIIFARKPIVSIFTKDPELIELTPPALLIVFLATPIVAVQLIGSAYFQAIGKALPALFLTLSRQGLILIPLLLILPRFFGLNGIWTAFPLSDVISTIITFFFLRKNMKQLPS